MGNCLTCFKEPPSAAQNNTSHCHKEEMPEVRFYIEQSHIHSLNSTALHETSLISNGNHLSSPPLNANTPVAAVTTAGSTLTRLCSTYQRRSIPSTNLVSVTSKSAPPVVTSTTTTAVVMGVTDSKSTTATVLTDNKLNSLFDQYRDNTLLDDDSAGAAVILPEGIEQLCKDLQLSPDDFKVLLFAWKLNAQQMCRFTRAEFVTGLKLLRVESIRGVQQKLPELVREVATNGELFKDLYRFTFRFGLDSAAGQRILPTDMALVLWRLVFTVREPPILQRWLRFLELHSAIRGIPKDTWNMFLNFAETVGDDLSSYDDNEAWPSLFDDFVEFENDQANQNISKEKDCNKASQQGD